MAHRPSAPRPSTRRTTVLAALLAGAGLLTATACSGDDSSDAAGAATTDKSTVSVTDATGAAVKIPAHPQRVVVLSEMDLDSALTLGIAPVGLTAARGQKGAPGYLADKAAKIPLVGTVTGPDIEKVVAAQPDVILAGQLADTQVLAQLRKVAPTLVTIGKDKDWKSSLTLTGKALGKSNEAKKFLARYDEKAAALKKDLGTRAGSEVSVARYSAKGTAVMQQGVFVSDVLKDLGFTRPGIQAKQGEGHSTPISNENLKEIDGDWLFIGTLDPTSESGLLKQLQAEPAYRSLKAVEDKHATVVDGSKWTSLGGAQAATSVLADIRAAMVK
ncbi:iron-siderophore ABC transporter substrate-binding protein [Streptomyces sp. SID11385]|uniref:ABC transporter substrate-binding protein n=1 Tax=Streptomyces sp. SID11385 TaxID=2706031 RepID=UPI0013CB1DC6|nr:iron-siderophore ABC transporter substrate-binding protein [Streptomyces sp. SID11385]NEA43760.1 iron-siderophore ABC transporter substrate-binding protein [Streptomyces sp. SID11385]